jgi:Permuted papain-like amidase enzyme, YaeF/YiiX, C92 family
MRKIRPRPQSPKGAPQSICLFDVKKLRPGDVVLERGPGSTSRVIRTFTRGAYSHALIFLGGTDFLEAVGVGARVISYVRVPIADPSAWVVLRYPDAQTAQRAADKARNLAHKKYATAAAFRSILPFRFKDDPSRLFCSQLVAEAYARAGATLVKGKRPNQITPRHLHKNSTLKPLQQIPTRKVIARNIPALDHDAEYADSPTARELRASQNAFQAVKHELNRLISALQVSPRPGSLIELFDCLVQAEGQGAHKEVAPMMEALERALHRENYFDFLPPLAREAEAAFLRDLDFAKSKQASALDRRYLAAQSAELLASYGKTLSRFEKNAEWFQSASENSQASLWSRLAQMSREAALATKKLIGVAQTVSRQMRLHEPTINGVRARPGPSLRRDI